MSKLILLVAFVTSILVVSGQPACPTEVSGDDEHRTQSGSCEEGYWSIAQGYECLSCSLIGCGGSGCADNQGCTSCSAGKTTSFPVYCTDVLNFKYCEGDGTTTTEKPNTEETSDEETSGDTEETDETVVVSSIPNNTITTDYAIAVFENYGLEGSVVVVRGHILVYLNFTYFDFDSISEMDKEECIEYGLYFGIFDNWNHNGYDSQIGTSECGTTYTGYRFDPWLACSDYSNNEYCKYSEFADDGCVPPQTYLNIDDDNIYTCSTYTFANNPFSCEVGDWSGKYGKLEYDMATKSFVGDYSSAFEVDAKDLSGKSIVFRCGLTLERTFCSGFTEFSPTLSSRNLDYIANDYGNSKSVNNYWEYWRTNQTDSHSKIARFSDKSWLKLTYYNTYDIAIDVSGLAIPGSCGDSLFYKIFDSATCEVDTNAIDGSASVTLDEDASFYDPTLTCNEESGWDGWYCEDSLLCNDGNYEYSCESAGYYQSVDRYYCGPSDLSNKYGDIDISEKTNFYFNISGFDDLMIPLSLLDDKSVVIQCENNLAIIGCATFESVNDNILIANTGDNDSDEDDSNSKKDKKDDVGVEGNIFGVSNTVAIVILVLLIAVMVPCIRALLCKKKDEHGMDSDEQKHKTGYKTQRQRVNNNINNNNNNEGTINEIHGTNGGRRGGLPNKSPGFTVMFAGSSAEQGGVLRQQSQSRSQSTQTNSSHRGDGGGVHASSRRMNSVEKVIITTPTDDVITPASAVEMLPHRTSSAENLGIPAGMGGVGVGGAVGVMGANLNNYNHVQISPHSRSHSGGAYGNGTGGHRRSNNNNNNSRSHSRSRSKSREHSKSNDRYRERTPSAEHREHRSSGHGGHRRKGGSRDAAREHREHRSRSRSRENNHNRVKSDQSDRMMRYATDAVGAVGAGGGTGGAGVNSVGSPSGSSGGVGYYGRTGSGHDRGGSAGVRPVRHEHVGSDSLRYAVQSNLQNSLEVKPVSVQVSGNGSGYAGVGSGSAYAVDVVYGNNNNDSNYDNYNYANNDSQNGNAHVIPTGYTGKAKRVRRDRSKNGSLKL